MKLFFRVFVTLTLLFLFTPNHSSGQTFNLSDTYGVGLYNPENSTLYLKNTLNGGPANQTFRFGPLRVHSTPFSGDWNGNGMHGIGLYSPSTGTFYLKNGLYGGTADHTFRFGPSGADWRPITGDWNGNGMHGIGLYSPSTGTFYLKNSLYGGTADHTFRFGPSGAGWRPVTGDWNGNGMHGIGLYSPSTGTFYLKNSLYGGTADYTFRFGPSGAGWRPITGDWNGNSMHGIGLYSPSTGTFYLKNVLSGGSADYTFRFGLSNAGWIPLAGNWTTDIPNDIWVGNWLVPTPPSFDTGWRYIFNNDGMGYTQQFQYEPYAGGWVPLGGLHMSIIHWTYDGSIIEIRGGQGVSTSHPKKYKIMDINEFDNRVFVDVFDLNPNEWYPETVFIECLSPTCSDIPRLK